MSRTYQKGADGHASIVVITLLACAAWTHKSAMLRAEHIAIVGIAAVVGVLCLVLAIRFLLKLRQLPFKQKQIRDVDSMTGLEFEQYVAALLKTHGYGSVHLTEQYDLGVDIVAVKDGITWGVQVKRYSGLVGADAVRQVVTALRMYNCDRAMVITNSYFSNAARSLAESNDCVLVDRGGLDELRNKREVKNLLI